MENTTKSARDNEIKGLECIHCNSVIFDIDSLVRHIREDYTHRYYKNGEGKLVLFIKLLGEEKQ